MADTPINGDPVKPEALENNATPVATPVVNATDTAEVERLKKENEQRDLRIRQLENEKSAREKAESEAEAERLKKNQEYQTLYEQERTKRETIERQREVEEQTKAISDAKQKTLAEYPDEVKAIAEDTGLTLSDVNDEAVTDFKAKLDKLQTHLGVQRVGANNPGIPSLKGEPTGVDLYVTLNDPVKRDAYYRAKGGLTAEMMGPAK